MYEMTFKKDCFYCCWFEKGCYICTPQTSCVDSKVSGKFFKSCVVWLVFSACCKEVLFFFKKACRDKKQLYICTRLGQYLK